MQKLHVQLRHVPVRNIAAMIHSMQTNVDMKILEDSMDKFSCLKCTNFETRKPKSVVTMPPTPMFNHEMAAIVFWFNAKPILHMMCTFTAYCQASVMASMMAAVVIMTIVNCWLCYFGPPCTLLCELGSEFANQEVRTRS